MFHVGILIFYLFFPFESNQNLFSDVVCISDHDICLFEKCLVVCFNDSTHPEILAS